MKKLTSLFSCLALIKSNTKRWKIERRYDLPRVIHGVDVPYKIEFNKLYFELNTQIYYKNSFINIANRESLFLAKYHEYQYIVNYNPLRFRTETIS